MSIIAQAERELAKWDAGERAVMLDILRKFFDTWDIDAADPRAAISFPYWPDRADVRSPVIEI